MPGSSDRNVESAFFHHSYCFYLILPLFTRAGSGQISEDSGPFILTFLFSRELHFQLHEFLL